MIHSGEPTTGIASEVGYAPFQPRVAFTYLSGTSTALAEQDAAVHAGRFASKLCLVELPMPELPVSRDASPPEQHARVALSEYQWSGPGRREPARRALDLAAALTALVALAPLLVLTGAAIRVLDGGEILVRDRRIGRFGREIYLLSFRTRAHANPRLVRFGRFLKRSGISSLPRLLNLLRGELTLVGPRPITEAELPHYGLDVIYYLVSRPGITGEWRIPAAAQSSRAAPGQQERAYVRTRTFRTDLQILLRTLPSAIAGKGKS